MSCGGTIVFLSANPNNGLEETMCAWFLCHRWCAKEQNIERSKNMFKAEIVSEEKEGHKFVG